MWGRSAEKTKKCVDDIKAFTEDDIPITAYSVLSEAVSGADVVATVTMTSEPVLHGEWLKPGALVCCKFVLSANTLIEQSVILLCILL